MMEVCRILKILVVSDSHGNKDSILEAVAFESPGLLLHLGDYDRDCAAVELEYPDLLVRSVKGNSDHSSSGLNVDEFVINGKRFYMTHGHLFGVKTGFSSIINAAMSKEVDVLLFGHTHFPYYTMMEELSVINPGSISMNERTYAVLEFKNGAVTCEIKSNYSRKSSSGKSDVTRFGNC